MTDRDKKLQCSFFFSLSFALMVQRQAGFSRPFPGGVDHFIFKFLDFYIINITLGLRGTEIARNESFIRAHSYDLNPRSRTYPQRERSGFNEPESICRSKRFGFNQCCFKSMLSSKWTD